MYNAFGQIEKGQDTGVDLQFIPVLGEFGIIGVAVFYGVWALFALRVFSFKRLVKGLNINEIAAGGLLTFWLVNSYTNHIRELPALALGFFFFLGMTMPPAETSKQPGDGVLFFVHSFWPMNGGVEQQALRQAKGLRARGFDVRVLTAQHQKGLKKYEIVESVPIYRFWYPYWISFKPLRKLANVIAGLLAFSQMPRKFQFRLLHIHQLQWFSIVGYLFKKKFGYKILGKGTSSGYRSDGLKFYDTLSILKGLAERLHLRERVYASIDKVVCISRIMVDELATYGVPKQNLVYVPNGIPLPNLAKADYGKEAGSMVSSMRFVPVKNPQLHVLAAIKLHKYHPELSFTYTIFGPGELLEETRQIVQASHATTYIKLPGATPNAEVLSVLSTASLFLNVSLSEGLSNSILESMSLGVPMLISDVGGAGDLIGSELPDGNRKNWQKFTNGGLVSPDISADALADVLYEMLSDQEYLHKAGQSARLIIEKEFALDIVLDKYEKLYRQLLPA